MAIIHGMRVTFLTPAPFTRILLANWPKRISTFQATKGQDSRAFELEAARQRGTTQKTHAQWMVNGLEEQ